MPRRQRELSPAAPILGRALIASAARYKGNEAPTTWHADSKGWQKEAYRHYRICGEARFSAQFFGHALAKTVLYVSNHPTSTERLKDGLAVERMDELFNGAGGQSALLSAAGVHLTVAGEFYIIGRTGPNGEDLWEVRSIVEVDCVGTGLNAKWSINGSGSQGRINLTKDDTVIRVWIPDPQDSICADSPFRSLLPILEEIEWLTKYVFAQASARVSGAGLLIMPEEMDLPPDPEAAGTPDEGNKASVLMRIMARVLGAAIADPGSTAAKIPSVITAPGEHIDKIKWMTFWSELDEHAQTLRQEAIQRFALGMDLPPERVLGMSTGVNSGGGHTTGANHWTAWQVDEDTIKMHIEPMLDVLAAALTVYYLRPTLDDPADAMDTVGYDTSNLRLRPDRSQEAMELYDRGLIGPTTVLRENGFGEDDAMTEPERIQWLTMKMAIGSATPEMVAQAAQILGVKIDTPTDGNQIPNEARPDPSLERPERDLPPDGYQLLAAYDALCYRALERAGNKIRSVVKNAGGEVPACSSFEVHTFIPSPESSVKRLLEDAWSCASNVLDPYDIDVSSTVDLLNGYVTSLLTTGNPHSRVALGKWLEAGRTAA